MPDPFDSFVFGKIIVAGEMLTVEVRPFSSRRLDPGTGKHFTTLSGLDCLPLLDEAGKADRIKTEYNPENRFVKFENGNFRNPSDNGRRSYPKLRFDIDKKAI